MSAVAIGAAFAVAEAYYNDALSITEFKEEQQRHAHDLVADVPAP